VGSRTAQRYETELLVTAKAVAALADEWRALEGRAQGGWSFYQRADWCLTWLERLGQGARPHVVTARQDGELVAVWPLMVAGGLGLRRLAPIGGPLAQYADALMDAGHEGDALAGALVERALEKPGCDVAAFASVPRTSPLARALMRRLGPSTAVSAPSFQLDLSTFETPDSYFASLSKLQKRNRNRRRNHLARLGELSFEVVWGGADDFAPLVAQAVAFKRAWLAESRRLSVGLSARGVEDFLGALGGDAAAREGAMVSVLRLDGRPIAIELGFLAHGHYHAYLGAFEPELAAHSPGKVQMDMTVGWLIEAGARCYDLLANEADYKQAWSNREQALVSTHHPYTLAGHVYARAWLNRLRPALKSFYGRMPELARRVMAFGQGLGCLLLYV
jgi:CelD/BcsL family acetyltransferase involved in cellulose biosynthesis